MSERKIEQGDSVASISAEKGFSPDTIWDAGQNATLKELRKDMNTLLPGDVLVVPEKEPKSLARSTAHRHVFRRKGVPAVFRLKVSEYGIPRATQEYELIVDGTSLKGTTDEDGLVEQFVPPGAREGKLIIGPDACELPILFGHQDPLDEVTGVQKRLINLGYPVDASDGTLTDATKLALLDLQTRFGLTPTTQPDGETVTAVSGLHRWDRPDDMPYGAKYLGDGWPFGKSDAKRSTISGSLGSTGKGETKGETNRYDVLPPPGYYVIIGRGVTAYYNHLTLLLSQYGRGRLRNALNPGPVNDPPVMHLGYEEPWSRRQHERMGQWPRMLDFFRGLGPAGLQGVPAEHLQNDWLDAAIFADSIADAERYLLGQYLVNISRTGALTVNAAAPRWNLMQIRDGFASSIESFTHWTARGGRGLTDALLVGPLWAAEKARFGNAMETMGDGSVWHNHDCPYRISAFHNGRHFFVYAYKIDICTGPGQPRTFEVAKFPGDAALHQAHLPVVDRQPVRYTAAAAPPPLIVNGNDYIGSDNDPNATVLVFKGNPIGAQSVQSALDMPGMLHGTGRVWWVAARSIRGVPPAAAGNGNEAAVPGSRNLLEMVGNSMVLHAAEGASILADHPAGAQWAVWGIRDLAFRDRLHRLSFHEVIAIYQLPDGRVMVFFTLHPRGDVNTPIPPAVPALAAQSLLDMQGESSVVPVPDSAAFGGRLWFLLANQFIYALGQDRGAGTEGTAAYLVRFLGVMNVVLLMGFPSYVTDAAADADAAGSGLVRVMGAAILDAPGGAAPAAVNVGHTAHGNTIPREGPAGGGGLNLAIPNIRRANRYLGVVKVNTASRQELMAAGMSATGAAWVVAARSASDRGYTVALYQTARFLSAVLVPTPLNFVLTQQDLAALATMEF